MFNGNYIPITIFEMRYICNDTFFVVFQIVIETQQLLFQFINFIYNPVHIIIHHTFFFFKT